MENVIANIDMFEFPKVSESNDPPTNTNITYPNANQDNLKEACSIRAFQNL